MAFPGPLVVGAMFLPFFMPTRHSSESKRSCPSSKDAGHPKAFGSTGVSLGMGLLVGSAPDPVWDDEREKTGRVELMGVGRGAPRLLRRRVSLARLIIGHFRDVHWVVV